MADLASLVSSIVELIDTGAEISAQLRGLGVRGLSREVAELCGVLGWIGGRLGDDRRCCEGLGEGFGEVLEGCGGRFGELRGLVDREGTRMLGDLAAQEEEVRLLRVQLEAYKTALKIMLFPAQTKIGGAELGSPIQNQLPNPDRVLWKMPPQRLSRHEVTPIHATPVATATPSERHPTPPPNKPRLSLLPSPTHRPFPRTPRPLILSQYIMATPKTTPPSHTRTLSVPTHKSTIPRPSHTRTISVPTHKSSLPRPTPPSSPLKPSFPTMPRTPPSTPETASLPFTDELTRIYDEPPQRPWCHPTKTRKSCAQTQESTLYALFVETLGAARDMERTKAMFQLKESWTKLRTSSVEFEALCAGLFCRIWTKLHEGVTRLTNMYKYFELVRESGEWVVVLTGLLVEMLAVRRLVEGRHERVQGVFVERDEMQMRAVRTVTRVLVDRGVIGRDARPCGEDTKLVPGQFEMTLERVQRFVGEINRGILRGLEADLVKVTEVIDATKDIIPAFGLASTGAVPSRRKLTNDPKTLDDLKAVSAKLMKGFSQVSYLLSEGTRKVALAEIKLAERPEYLDKRIYVVFKEREEVGVAVGKGQGVDVRSTKACGVTA